MSKIIDMSIKSYQDLIVWQKSMLLVTQIYQATQDFPKHEIFGLTSQIRRAAVSVAGNVAEGWGRSSKKTFALFLNYSKGSLTELETYTIIAKNLGYMNEVKFLEINNLAGEIGKMIYSLQHSLRRSYQ